MANNEHLRYFREGNIEAWNRWRKRHPDIQPDLKGAVLRDFDLSGADLRDDDLSVLEPKQEKPANLSKAKLIGAKLNRANLRKAELIRTALYKADLSNANMSRTKLFKAKLGKAILKEANLSLADLRVANLSEANLSGARIVGADLRSADFSEADLSRATLQESTFSGANLNQATFLRADLTNAHLAAETISSDPQEEISRSKKQDENKPNKDEKNTETVYLPDPTIVGTNFGMALLPGAKLPVSLRNFEDTLDKVEETSKNARPIFLTLIGLCAFALLTTATTTDAQLILNNFALKLPIINAEVPVIFFYICTPLSAFFVFIYLQMYLSHLWELVAKLPSVFPDGLPLRKKLYPWMINLIIEEWQQDERKEGASKEKETAPLSRTRALTAIFLV
ncbi:pentapeptide repeat-containing protein [candidate division KSB1 bacterium]|nr:pentapeptide repeat-containing protein [candidate division KSB1 bacterium]NIR69512.1 pentapeptide repeat-containing protein [candidate division KSB1 bacterium]NIS24280.1 pentapeptide repeat-containing protein [candidate division KSB1 bacterium]NIT71195.1 pentapeptide repeat-containing protein [candidate division KSB1 bacterium]NIU24899.1 pentapeptide repeat-containing protein [candidate division KSB1 bacterium]